MAKVIKPIKEEWNKIEENKNSPIELARRENDSGIVRIKRLKNKKK